LDDVLEARRAAAAQLKRNSLAGGSGRARQLVWFYVGAAGMIVLGALAIFAMREQDGSAPHAPATDQPRIQEQAASPAPLASGTETRPRAPAAAAASSAPKSAGAPGNEGNGDPSLAAAARVEAERRRAEEEGRRRKEEALREARLKSALFAGDAADQMADATAAAAQGTGTGQALASSNTQGQRGGTGLSDANSLFARAVQDADDASYKATKIANRQCKIEPGAILHGHVLPRIVSDLPGTVTIVLDQDAFGDVGRIPLLPWGTTITAQPNPNVRKGQDRAYIQTATAERPDGVKIRLNSPVGDQLGSAGLQGDVNNHTGQILGMSAVLALLGAGASTYGAANTNGANSVAAYREGVQSSLAQGATQLLNPYVNIAPTITIQPGARVRIEVEHELDFSDYCHPTEDG
jgi:type IV secretion system protein VirB10